MRTQIIQARFVAVIFLILMVVFGGVYCAALEAGYLPMAGAALVSVLLSACMSIAATLHLSTLEQQWSRYAGISRATLRRRR